VKLFFSLIFILILSNAFPGIPDTLLLVSRTLKHDTDKVNFFYKEGFEKRASDPQYSYECAKKAEQYAQKSKLPYYIAKASNLLGVLYYRKNDLQKALTYHQNALNQRIIIGDVRGIALSQTNLGNIYTDLKMYGAAEASYLLALQSNTELNDLKQAGNCLLNLGVLKAEQKLFDIAKNYFEQALRNATMRYDYELKALCLNNLADINIALKQPDDAIASCINSIKAKELMDNEMEMADSYLTLAKAFFLKGDIPEGRNNLNIADSIIRKFNYTTAMVSLLKLRSEQFELEKNYEAAFRSLSRHHALSDSISCVEKNTKLDNDFLEATANTNTAGEKPFTFPYFYLNLLIISFVLVVVFIFFPRQ
jgi:tetratricopeptide (TPR) repeat protein